jgi:ABC-type Fe3+ transport system substrate-binding protein
MNMFHGRKRSFATFPLVLFLLGLHVALAQCAERRADLVIISPHWEGLRYEFARAFSDWHLKKHGAPAVVEWIDQGGTSDDIKFVISEFQHSPHGIGIDLFFGGGIDPFFKLQREGLLSRYDPPNEILSRIPPELGGVPLYDQKREWFGVALSSFGIVFNKRVLALQNLPEPKNWADLARPEYAGWIGAGDPRNSGSVHMMYELILQAYGWDEGWALILKMAGNTRSFERGAASVAKDTTFGDTACAMAIDFYGLTQVGYAGGGNMGFVLPPEVAVINPDGIAILKGAPHREMAERFVDFCLSEEGQKLLLLPRGHKDGGAKKFSVERMCVWPSLYERYHPRDTLVPTNPFALKMAFQYDPRKGGARWDLVNGLIGSTIIDLHPELVAAWRRVRANGMREDDVKEFCRMPLSEQEAISFVTPPAKDAPALWDPKTNAEFINKQLIAWQQWARAKYRVIK